MIQKLTKTVALFAILTAFGTAFAQTPGVAKPDKGTNEARQGRGAKMLEVQKEVLATLKLNAKQTKEIAALNKARADKMKANGERAKAAGQTADREKMRAEFQKSREEYNAKLKTIMGDKTFAKYESLMKEKMKALRDKKDATGTAKTGKGGGN